MPVRFGSCYTAVVEGQGVEGHVPANEICRFLQEKADAVGISVLAIPRGFPGMDNPACGGIRDPYDVTLVHRDGRASICQSYR